MESPLDRYDRAIAAGASVLDNVRPDQLDDATPCASWKVRELVNHFVGANEWFAALMGGPEATGADFANGDYVAAFRKVTDEARARFAAPGALEREVQLPWGPSTGVGVLGIACTDSFTHAWDLAKATGQSTDLDPELAEDLLIGAKASIQEGFRGDEASGAPFGVAQPVDAAATAADRLAAFLGRVV